MILFLTLVTKEKVNKTEGILLQHTKKIIKHQKMEQKHTVF